MTPYTWQYFLWAAATVIFGQFWSIFFAKSACHTHCRGGGNNGVQMSFHPPQKGRCHFSRIEGHFPKLRAGPQFRRTSWYPAMIKRSRNRQENNKELLFQMEKRTPYGSNRLFLGLKHSKNGWNFFHTSLTYMKFTFCKKMEKNDQPQQWSEENTAAYMGSPPLTGWSRQRANDRYKDHLDGQLTTGRDSPPLYAFVFIKILDFWRMIFITKIIKLGRFYCSTFGRLQRHWFTFCLLVEIETTRPDLL